MQNVKQLINIFNIDYMLKLYYFGSIELNKLLIKLVLLLSFSLRFVLFHFLETYDSDTEEKERERKRLKVQERRMITRSKSPVMSGKE